MRCDKKSCTWILFVLISTLFVSLFSISDFLHHPIKDEKDVFLSFFHWMPIFISLIAPIGIISLNKIVFGIFYPLIVVILTILAYYRVELNFSINPVMLEVISSNDIKTTVDLITFPLIGFIVFTFLISLILVYYRRRFDCLLGKGICFILPFLFFTIFANLNPPFNRTFSKRLPFNIIHVLNTYVKNRQEIEIDRKPNYQYVESDSANMTIVVIIGESLRADHLGLNGYYRNTTPLLTSEDVISFPNIKGHYTITNHALPDLLTRADALNPDLAFKERSFIDLFNATGFSSYFLSNQDSETPYFYFINEARSRKMLNKTFTPYSYEKWLDEDLLPDYYEIVSDTSQQKKIIILHTIGSHFWYNAHYTENFEQYKPVMKSKILSQCTREEVVNSYDNTILYTDSFIAKIIDSLKGSLSALFYFSDHGELLGEEGKYMHGMSVETEAARNAQQNIALMVWMSDSYREKHPQRYQNSIRNKLKNYDADVIYHSILHLGGIRSDVIDFNRSLFENNH